MKIIMRELRWSTTGYVIFHGTNPISSVVFARATEYSTVRG
jgi:hypothetical protein